MPRALTSCRKAPPPVLATFEEALAKLPEGYVDGNFGNRSWGVTVKRSEDGKRTWLYGEELGAFAVARATMPLVFFEKSDYAAAMATIALPMNLINALAPPVLAALMVGIGAHAVFAVLGALSTMAFIVLWQLNRKRPSSAIAG